MFKETGRIIAIEPKQKYKKSIAVIECISKSACSSCHNSSQCGVGVVAKAYSDKKHQFEVPYKKGMRVNEFIEIQVNNSDLIKSASLAYLFPLLFFIGGALFANQFDRLNEIQLILVAISSAVIGFAITRILSNKFFPKEALSRIISTRVNNNDE